MTTTIGIEIHKATLMIAIHQGRQWELPNTAPGRARLVAQVWPLRPDRIVLEPSGGYERPVLAALQEAQLPVALVPAQQVRHFAWAGSIRAKSDRLRPVWRRAGPGPDGAG